MSIILAIFLGLIVIQLNIIIEKLSDIYSCLIKIAIRKESASKNENIIDTIKHFNDFVDEDKT